VNYKDKDQIIEILKARSTEIKASYVEHEAQTALPRKYGKAFRNADKKNAGFTIINVQIYFKHSEPAVITPKRITKAEDPFNPEATDGEIEVKTCDQCGHHGNLIVYLECPTHGKFKGE